MTGVTTRAGGDGVAEKGDMETGTMTETGTILTIAGYSRIPPNNKRKTRMLQRRGATRIRIEDLRGIQRI